MAGISFLRARSPVTPNITTTHGPATRGMRRSRGSRSGLTGSLASSSAASTPGLAGARPRVPAFVGTSIFGTSKFLCLRQPKTTAAAAKSEAELLGVQVQLVLDGLEQLVPGHLELGHALVLEDLDHVVVADAEPLEVGEDLPRLVVG